MTPKRLQWLFAALTALILTTVVLYAQNPVSITQVGTTAVTTTVPVSGTVTITDGAGAVNVIVDSGALTVSATNLDIQSGGADVLSESAFLAAFGTAGSADSQVMSVQGIASGTALTVTATNLDVQIGGSDTLSVNPGTAANWGIYVEDAGETAGGNLVMVGTVRRDTAASSAGTTADNATFNTDSTGLLWVRIGASDVSASGGTSLADDADFTDGTTAGTPIGGVAESASPSTVTEGDFGWVAITLNRAMKVTMFDTSGNAVTPAQDWTASSAIGSTAPGQMVEAKDFDGSALPQTASAAEGDAIPTAGSLYGIQYVMVVNEDGSLERGTSTTPLVVGDGSGAMNVIVDSGTVTTVSTVTTLSQLGGVALPVEDAGETAAGVGIYAMGVRRDTPASSAGASGDNTMASYNAVGALYTAPGGASVHYRTAAGSTEDEHEIKATAGILYSILITNTNAAARYIRCYNLTAANTTPGSSTVFWGAAIPGATAGAGFAYEFPSGLTFDTALTCTWTTGAADTDVAEVAANEIKATYTYR